MQPKEDRLLDQKDVVPMAPTVYISFPDKSGVVIAFVEKKDIKGNRLLGECLINIHSLPRTVMEKTKDVPLAQEWANANWRFLEELKKRIIG